MENRWAIALLYEENNKIKNKALRITVFDEGYNISTRPITYSEETYNKGFKLTISPIKRGDSIICFFIKEDNILYINIFTKEKLRSLIFMKKTLFHEGVNLEIRSCDKTIVFKKDKVIMAGPCAIESYDQLLKTAKFVKSQGANILRGGAFKPRTSPSSFKGLKEEGLEILKGVKEETKLAVITELMDVRDLEKLYAVSDIIQIGSRNMQNFSLLTEVGKQDKPVMLKRGISATISEWIGAAEYIAQEGNQKIIMCERGIRTYNINSLK